jgi:SNF2 family DNA or RNA helicase
MPHQAIAVKKMLPTRVGALFMDMGTGKTRTAIEIIHHRQKQISKIVWFCPVSLKETIKHEITKHTDSKDIYCFDQKTNQRNINDVFWYVVGIESMSLSARVILTINELIDTDTFVIVDESSYIKGHRSARTNWITNLSERAKYRMILTGTPISQGVVDLFSQFRFLSPKILGYASFYSFAANHLEYSDKFPNMIVRAHNTEWLAAKIKPYVYQVTKDECLDLPKKLYETRYFSMTNDQREWYENVKMEALEYMEEWNSYTIFQLFSKLQQIVCGFLNAKNIIFPHDRVDIMHSVIEQIQDDEKIIIWCKYEHDIMEITEALGSENVAQFYGKVNLKNREKSILDFKNEKRFFLATESCGGHGLTLNESNYTIFYNNGFKYAERMQAEDRNHRIGQAKPVTYIDIICKDSIDERIDQAIYSKGSVVQDFKREIDLIKNKKGTLKNLVKGL